MLIKNSRIPVKELILFGFFPSGIKKIIYRLMGYKIGKKVRIGFGSVVIGKQVTIEDYSEVGIFTIVRANTIKMGRYSLIGSFTYITCTTFEIGEDSKIREQVNIGGTLNIDSDLKIGSRCSIGQSCYINPSRPIIIGDDTAIGGAGFIFTHASWQSVIDGFPVKYEPVTIGKNVYIAWRVFILPGIEIGDNSTIGADSTVSINIPNNSLAAGSPIKIALSGPEKWPRPILQSTKIKLIEKINDEFSTYLQYHGYSISIERKEFMDRLLFNDYNVSIFFYKTNEQNITFEKNNIYLLFNHPEVFFKNSMILNMNNKSRSGKSRFGEEYVRFLSRFGIRFKRID